MRIISVLVITFVLVGCTRPGPSSWAPASSAGKTVSQAWLECDFEAEKAAPMMDRTTSAFAQAFAQGDIRRKCMKAKGFYQVR